MDDDVDLKPSFGDDTIANRRWTTSTVVPRLELPEATGGDGTLTYTLSPAVPSWLSRSGFFVTGTTPDEEVAQVDYTWTVRDEDGDEDSLTFSIRVTTEALPPGDSTNGDGRTVNRPPFLSLSSPRVSEGAAGSTATLTYTLTLSKAGTRTVTVSYADAGTGTATAGTDYTALAPGTLTVAPGVTSATISVTVTGDGIDEPDETVTVEMSMP